MIRQIIKIDSEKCNGCGACVKACHEGAIAMIDGKAKLTRDDYCDGLGNCLPACPTNAITFENREAAAFDDIAVKKNMDNKLDSKCPSTKLHTVNTKSKLPCGCPSTASITIEKKDAIEKKHSYIKNDSELRQFPIQIKLVPSTAPYFNGCDLLIAADCTAFAYGSFHEDFIKGKITLIGCPKLDEGNYSDKLSEILIANDIKSLTVIKMEVPCCGGIVEAVKSALKNSGKIIPWQIVTISRNGEAV